MQGPVAGWGMLVQRQVWLVLVRLELLMGTGLCRASKNMLDI